MATMDFPQELLDTIVDEVAGLDPRSLRSLLNSSQRFGRKCRLHLYSQVKISPRSPPSAFHDLVTQYNVGHLVNTLYVVFSKDDTQPFWSMIGEIMSRLTRLKDVVLTEILGSRIPPAKMLVADLPRLSTVQGVTFQYVRRLSVEDVAHVFSAFPNLLLLELSRCTMDERDPSTTSVAPRVQIALETLSVVDAQHFVASVFAGSVNPPIISLRKLRRLVIGGVFKQRIWPSYDGLFRQIQGTVREVIIYTKPDSCPRETSLFVNVPSLIVVPLGSDFDFLADMLHVSQVGMHTVSPGGLRRLALVFNWTSNQNPCWSNLVDLLAKLTPLPFSVCITLAWTSGWGDSYHSTQWADIRDEVLKYFTGIKRLVRVQIVDLDLAEWDFHMKSTEYLYY